MAEGAHWFDEAPPALQIAEYLRCKRSPAHFIERYVQIETKDEGGEGGGWSPFDLWPAQREVLDALVSTRLLVLLKARQLGMTWLLLAFYLWKILFRPGSAVGLWSRRENEAVELLDRRVKGMYARLPCAFRAARIVEDSKTVWALSNGSRMMAFPTSAGDSYTFTDALVDEADFCPDLSRLIDAVKPTIDGGGRMVLLSKADKTTPASTFKRLARQGLGEGGPWRTRFLPWTARPGRCAAWYEEQRQHSLSQDGTTDFLHGNYPATPAEALAPSSSDKRFPADWMERCYAPEAPRSVPGAPPIPGLCVYRPPVEGRRYCLGADPAEGLATGDDSAAKVVDRETGEECASLAGKLEPRHEFPHAIALLARFFNNAAALIERNNHGHAVIAGAEREGVIVLNGLDGRPGWAATRPAKVDACDAAAAVLRDGDAGGNGTLHDPATHLQVAQLHRQTLKHPDPNGVAVDDHADAWILAQRARSIEPPALLMGWA